MNESHSSIDIHSMTHIITAILHRYLLIASVHRKCLIKQSVIVDAIITLNDRRSLFTDIGSIVGSEVGFDVASRVGSEVGDCVVTVQC